MLLGFALCAPAFATAEASAVASAVAAHASNRADEPTLEERLAALRADHEALRARAEAFEAGEGSADDSPESLSSELLELAIAPYESSAPDQRRSWLAGWVVTVIALERPNLTAPDRDEFWTRSIEAAWEIGWGELVHSLVYTDVYLMSAERQRQEGLQLAQRALRDFPGATTYSLYLHYFIGGQLYGSGRFDEACARFRQLLDENRAAERGDPALANEAELLLANSYVGAGDLELAAEILQPRIERARESGGAVPKNVAKPWVEYLLGSADHSGAIDFIERELRDTDAYPTGSPDRARMLARLGIARAEAVLVGVDDGGSARANLREALGGAPLPSSTRDLAHLSLAELEWIAGDEEAFLRELERAETIVDGNDPLERLRLESLRGRRDRIEGADRERLAERLRSMEIEWHSLVESWASLPPSVDGYGYLYSGDRQDALGYMIEFATELEPGPAGVRRALSYVIELGQAGELMRGAGGESITVDDLRDRLVDDRHGLLTILPARRGVHLFGLDRSTAWYSRLAGIRDLLKLSKTWKRRLSLGLGRIRSLEEGSSEVRAEREAARELSDALFPSGVREKVEEWSAWTCVGLEVLLPSGIEWLPLGDEPALGLNREVWSWPSLPAGERSARVARARGASGDRVLIAGAARHSASVVRDWPGLPDLSLPESIVEHAEALAGDSGLRVLRGSELSVDSIDSALRETADLAVFFLHAVRTGALDVARPTALVSSGDEANPDGLWFASRLDPLRESGGRAPRFTVLSACRGGDGEHSAGSDIGNDLASAFLRAGGEAVLSSRIDLPVGPSERFVLQLLDDLAAGGSPAHAVRAARQTMAEELGVRAPFVLHGMQLLGACSTPLFPVRAMSSVSPADRSNWLVPAGILAALAIAWAWGRRSRTPRI